MKIRLVVAIVGLAIGFPASGLAQQQRAVVPRVREQIEDAFMKFQEAYNSHDVAAITALYTQDGVEFREWEGIFSGQEAIEKKFADDFASNPGKMVNKLVQVYPIADAVCVIFDMQIGGSLGEAVRIYVRHGDGWKIRTAYVEGDFSVH